MMIVSGVPITNLNLIESIAYNPVTWVLLGLVLVSHGVVIMIHARKDKEQYGKIGRNTIVSMLLSVITLGGMVLIVNMKANSASAVLTSNEVQIHYGIIENKYKGGFLPVNNGDMKTLRNVQIINKHGEIRTERIVVMRMRDNEITASTLDTINEVLIELPALGIPIK